MARSETQPEASPNTHAIALLKQDRRTMEQLFEAFEQSDETKHKHRIAQQICKELKVHVDQTTRSFPRSDRGVGSSEGSTTVLSR